MSNGEWVGNLRQALPVTERCVYLQTGSLGPLSRPVLQALAEAEGLAASEGPAAPGGLTPLVQASEQARTVLGELLTVPASELAWSLNTSTAMRTVIHSLQLTSGDRLITSDQEHVATRSLYNGLADEIDLPTVLVSSQDSDEAFLARLADALRQPSKGRKLVLLSHVSCIDGRILPVTEAVKLAHQWDALTLIDGAQAVGQIPVDVSAIGADFYIGSGHKWLLGPSGIGYIHINRNHLADFNPNWLPNKDRQHATAAALGEAGTTNLAQRAALHVALQTMQQIGMTNIASHCQQVTQQLRAGLQALPDVTLLGPAEPERTTGLVGFTISGYGVNECKQLVSRLYEEQRILIKYQPEQCGLRVSIAAFNTAGEVEQLLGALA